MSIFFPKIDMMCMKGKQIVVLRQLKQSANSLDLVSNHFGAKQAFFHKIKILILNSIHILMIQIQPQIQICTLVTTAKPHMNDS